MAKRNIDDVIRDISEFLMEADPAMVCDMYNRMSYNKHAEPIENDDYYVNIEESDEKFDG